MAADTDRWFKHSMCKSSIRRLGAAPIHHFNDGRQIMKHHRLVYRFQG